MHAANGGYNGIGLVLAVLAAIRFTRDSSSSDGVPGPGGRKGVISSPLPAACGIGGLFFGLHSLLSDTSTMILWVWDGYPVRGPLSVPHGWLTIAAMSAVKSSPTYSK